MFLDHNLLLTKTGKYRATFNHFSVPCLNAIAGSSSTRIFKAGEKVFLPNIDGHLITLLEGAAFVHHGWGKKYSQALLAGHGDAIGLREFFLRAKKTITIDFLYDSKGLLTQQDLFWDVIDRYDTVNSEVLRVLATMAMGKEQKPDKVQQLAELLFAIHEKLGSDIAKSKMQIDSMMLEALAGIDDITLKNELEYLQSRGLISSFESANGFKILDPQGLAIIAAAKTTDITSAG